MKKCVLAALAFAAAATMASAQASQLKKGTAGLIKDGAIDKLDFGLEDKDGIVFGAIDSNNTVNGTKFVELGWGQYLGENNGLWLSIYDRYRTNGSTQETESVTKTYSSADGINVDYTDTTKSKTRSGAWYYLDDYFAVGIGLSNGLGFQPYWYMDWDNRDTLADFTAGSAIGNNSDTESQSSTATASGTKTSTERSDAVWGTYNNTWGVKFNGITTPKLLGERELYFKLNEVRAKYNKTECSGKFSNSTTVNGTTTTSNSADGTNISGYFIPGINMEMGLNIGQFGPAKTTFELEEDFEMGFDASESNSHYTTVIDTAATKTTTSTDYEKNFGDYLSWTNTLTPKFIFDFDVDERLTLKARARLALGITHTGDDGDGSTVTETVTTYDKASSTTTVARTTTKDGAGQNVSTTTTTFTPTFDLGFVYEAVPGRLNLNFGVTASTGTYTWTKKDTTNSNDNDVVTTSATDALGNTTSTTAVTVNSGATEKSEYSFNDAASSARVYLGATWFFTEDVKMDVYLANDAAAVFGNTNEFGIDFSIRY